MSKLNATQENFAGAVQTLTNTGSAGGSMNYINLGGLKLLWGRSAAISITALGQTNPTFIWPSGFFTSISSSILTEESNSASNKVTIFWNTNVNTSNGTASVLEFANVATQLLIDYLIIGT